MAHADAHRRTALRRAAAAAAGGLLAGTLLLAGAAPAGAADDPTHGCFPIRFIGDDDGLVTDLVHHHVEPLVPARQTVHELNCQVSGTEEILLDTEYHQELLAYLLSAVPIRLPALLR